MFVVKSSLFWTFVLLVRENASYFWSYVLNVWLVFWNSTQRRKNAYSGIQWLNMNTCLYRILPVVGRRRYHSWNPLITEPMVIRITLKCQDKNFAQKYLLYIETLFVQQKHTQCIIVEDFWKKTTKSPLSKFGISILYYFIVR